jgi:hypothetical protein
MFVPAEEDWTKTQRIQGKYTYNAGAKNVSPVSAIGNVVVICAVTFYGSGSECPSFEQIRNSEVEATVIQIRFLLGTATVPLDIKPTDGRNNFYWSQTISSLRNGWFVRSIIATLIVSSFLSALLVVNFTNFFDKGSQ